MPRYIIGTQSVLIKITTYIQFRASRQESIIKVFRKGENRADFTKKQKLV